MGGPHTQARRGMCGHAAALTAPRPAGRAAGSATFKSRNLKQNWRDFLYAKVPQVRQSRRAPGARAAEPPCELTNCFPPQVTLCLGDSVTFVWPKVGPRGV